MLNCNIGNVTICEIDQRVPKIAELYFPEKHQLITEAIKEEKLKLIFKNGAEYVKERSEQIEKLQADSLSCKDLLYDAVIIDCTDVCIE